MSTQNTAAADADAGAVSRFNLRTISLILLVIAIGISGYLSFQTATAQPVPCAEGGGFNCEVVQSSAYSEFAGIKVAYLGLLTNLVLLGILVLEPRVAFLHEYGLMIFFGIVLFAMLFSLWLIYVQAAFLQAYCAWCLAHEAVIIALFIVTGVRVKQAFFD